MLCSRASRGLESDRSIGVWCPGRPPGHACLWNVSPWRWFTVLPLAPCRRRWARRLVRDLASASDSYPWAGAWGQSVACAGRGLGVFGDIQLPSSLCKGFVDRFLRFSPPPLPYRQGLAAMRFMTPAKALLDMCICCPSHPLLLDLQFEGSSRRALLTRNERPLREGGTGSDTRKANAQNSARHPPVPSGEKR